MRYGSAGRAETRYGNTILLCSVDRPTHVKAVVVHFRDRDLQRVAQLEQHDMNSEITKNAFVTIMRARRACYDARIPERLALHDDIQALVSVTRAR
jgi:hypothetical protein